MGKKPKILAYRVVGDVAYISLSQGLEAIIDVADIALVDGRGWYAIKSRKTSYAMSKTRGGKPRHLIGMHRLVISAPDGAFVDHINGNGLDNRRSNLRLAEHQENLRNRGANENSKSGVKGVYRLKSGRWAASFWEGAKSVHLGTFDTLDEATSAYNSKAAAEHGDFFQRT